MLYKSHIYYYHLHRMQDWHHGGPRLAQDYRKNFALQKKIILTYGSKKSFILSGKNNIPVHNFSKNVSKTLKIFRICFSFFIFYSLPLHYKSILVVPLNFKEGNFFLMLPYWEWILLIIFFWKIPFIASRKYHYNPNVWAFIL